MKLSETLHFIDEYLYLCTTYSIGVSFIMNLISNHEKTFNFEGILVLVNCKENKEDFHLNINIMM